MRDILAVLMTQVEDMQLDIKKIREMYGLELAKMQTRHSDETSALKAQGEDLMYALEDMTDAYVDEIAHNHGDFVAETAKTSERVKHARNLIFQARDKIAKL